MKITMGILPPTRNATRTHGVLEPDGSGSRNAALSQASLENVIVSTSLYAKISERLCKKLLKQHAYRLLSVAKMEDAAERF